MPHRDVFVFPELDAIKSRCQRKQPGDNRARRKVLAQLLVRNRELRLLIFLQPERDVPELEFHARKFLECIKLAFGGIAGACGELAQELQNFFARLGHLRRQRVVGVIFKPNQIGCLVA